MRLRGVIALLLSGATTLPVGPCDVVCVEGKAGCFNSDSESVNAPPQVTDDIAVHSERPPRGARGPNSVGAATVDWQTIFTIGANDPDNDPLLIQWDLNGDGEFEQGGRGEPTAGGAYPGERVTTFYRTPGTVPVTARAADFPKWQGAPGEVTRTRLVHILSQEMRDSNRPPTGAAFTFSPQSPIVGQDVRFEAAQGVDPDVWDNPLRYGWRFSGPFPSAPIRGRQGFDLRAFNESFPGPGTYTVTLTLIDALGESSPEASQQIVVREPGTANTPPTARFVARPPAPFVGQEVTFDASESSDLEGRIIRYEWDTNSDGAFDVTSSQPTTTENYGMPGEKLITLQVTDTNGATDTERRPINVRPSPGFKIGGPLFASASKARLQFSARVDGSLQRGSGNRATGNVRAGFVDAPGRGETRVARRLRRFFNARWRLRVSRKFDARTGRLTANGVALARPRGDRRSAACIRVRIDGVRGKPPGGRLTLLGGTGTAARLRGSARFVFRLESGGAATVLGPISAREGKARPLPRACRGLR